MNVAPSTPTLSSELKQLIEQRNVLTTRTKSRVINALDSHIRKDRENKKLMLKSRAIEEIYTSEVSYLNHLEIAMKYFKNPLLESKLPIPETLRSLFENLESVYKVNGELLNQLRIHGEDVAGAFKKVAPFFKLYSVYAYEYRHGMASLQELPKSNGKLDAFIKRQETRPEVGMRLGSLLIAPIQRIPRYRLLLKELLNYTPTNHPHYNSILEAIKEVEIATEHINTLVSEQENMDRIIELHKSLVGGNPELVKPGRRLLKEGILLKMSKRGKKARQRYLILMSDIIVYCKMTGALFGEANSLRCSCVFPLRKCSIQHTPSEKSFQIICNPNTITLFSDEPYSTESWVSSIKQAIVKDQENQQTLKRKGSGRRIKKREVNTTHNSLTPKKRKQSEEVGDTISYHSPWKKNKVTSECSSNMDTSSELDEIRPKQMGYFSSIKKAISSFGQSLNKYWFPVYQRRDTSLERRITN